MCRAIFIFQFCHQLCRPFDKVYLYLIGYCYFTIIILTLKPFSFSAFRSLSNAFRVWLKPLKSKYSFTNSSTYCTWDIFPPISLKCYSFASVCSCILSSFGHLGSPLEVHTTATLRLDVGLPTESLTIESVRVHIDQNFSNNRNICLRKN